MLTYDIKQSDLMGGEYRYATLEEPWWSDDTRGDILLPFGLTEAEMAELRSNGPYIWVTWLPRLLVGEDSCEWASWFKARYEGWSWDRIPSTFNLTEWQMNHTSRVNEVRDALEEKGLTVFTENQNGFVLRGRSAALGGRPDLITRSGPRGTILDIKKAQPSAAHDVQVMIYMYGIPRALPQYQGVVFDGRVVYDDHEVEIAAAAIDDKFVDNLARLIGRISSSTPARKVPSVRECNRCPIPHAECPEREAESTVYEAETEDF